MAPDYRKAAIQQINHWLWTKLQTLDVGADKAFAAYAPNGSINLVPIIPAQQDPDFVNIAGGAPFIVYNYTVSAQGDNLLMHREQNAYVIYDSDESRLRAIQNYMIDLLRRMDVTAQEINATTGGEFDIKHVDLTHAISPDAYRDEGGRQAAVVVISYEFTHEIDNDTILRV